MYCMTLTYFHLLSSCSHDDDACGCCCVSCFTDLDLDLLGFLALAASPIRFPRLSLRIIWCECGNVYCSCIMRFCNNKIILLITMGEKTNSDILGFGR